MKTFIEEVLVATLSALIVKTFEAGIKLFLQGKKKDDEEEKKILQIFQSFLIDK